MWTYAKVWVVMRRIWHKKWLLLDVLETLPEELNEKKFNLSWQEGTRLTRKWYLLALKEIQKVLETC